MSNPIKVIYTAQATAEGGREGHAHSSDARLDVDLDVPVEMGGAGGPGTNPEQLFAAGYAACFQSTLMRLAARQNLDLADSRVTARVGFGMASDHHHFGLTVALDLQAPRIERRDAIALMQGAHDGCPYSRATRGNVDVALTIGGIPILRPAPEPALIAQPVRWARQAASP